MPAKYLDCLEWLKLACKVKKLDKHNRTLFPGYTAAWVREAVRTDGSELSENKQQNDSIMNSGWNEKTWQQKVSAG